MMAFFISSFTLSRPPMSLNPMSGFSLTISSSFERMGSSCTWELPPIEAGCLPSERPCS